VTIRPPAAECLNRPGFGIDLLGRL